MDQATDNAPQAGSADVQDDLDALCRRCGECCRFKVAINGQRYVTDDFCPHLDPATRLCRIYADRDRLRQHGLKCLTAREAVAKGEVPPDCPYVRVYCTEPYTGWGVPVGQWHQ